MEAGQNLFLNNMMSKLKKAKEDLEKNNETLEEAKDKIRAFTNDNTFQGEAANAAKTQMETYILVANAMIQANDCDIEDYYTLNHMLWETQQSLTFEDLIGEVIVEQMNKAERMAEQDRERAVEIDRMQTKSHNPFLDAWYQMKEIYYKESAEDNEELYKEWKKRADKYDEIENSTSSLFEKGEQLRQQAENALRELGKNFNGTSFDVADDGEWKIKLINTMNKNGYVGLDDGFFVITGGGEEYFDQETQQWKEGLAYGGNQNWFDEEYLNEHPELKKFFKDKELNKVLGNNGCGVIALINMFYYLEGEKKVSQLDFMKRVYDFVNSQPILKYQLLLCTGTRFSGMDDDIPIITLDWNGYIHDYLGDHYSKANFNNFQSGSIYRIENSIKKGMPVSINIDELDEGEDVKLYKFKEGELMNDGATDRHFVVATGTKMIADPNTGELKKYIEVSNWGGKHYILYDELVKKGDDISYCIIE